MNEEILLKLLFYPSVLTLAYSLWSTLKGGKIKESFNIAGGKGGGGGDNHYYSPPPPPDPFATARAQSAADRETARTNALLLNPTVNSPYGRVRYTQNTEKIGDDTIQRPVQTIELSEANQRNLNKRNELTDYLGNVGVNLARQMPNNPFDTSRFKPREQDIDFSGVDRIGTINDFQNDRKRIEDAVYNRQLRLLQPELQRREDQIRERLIQTGNPQGSQAYTNELNRFDKARNQALADLADRSVRAGSNEQDRLFNLGNMLRQQQIGEAYRPYQVSDQIRRDQLSEGQMLRNQQINELAALLQGREAINNPMQAQYSQAALRSPDLMGMINQNYGHQLNAYNTRFNNQEARDDAFMEGLFSLGGAGLGFAMGGPSGGMMGANMGGRMGRMF